MKPLKQRGTVTLPSEPREGQTPLKVWCMQAHKTLQQLRDRVSVAPPVGPKGRYAHPFKMFTVDDSGLKLRVYHGMVTQLRWASAAGGGWNTTESDVPLINTGVLTGNPEGGTVGQISLSASTTYGVWIRATLATTASVDPPKGGTYDGVTYYHERLNLGNMEIVVSSTYTEHDDGVDFTAANTDNGYQYIGKVTVDGDSVATIQQWLKSDVFWPTATLSEVALSTDSPNALTIGTDDGLLLDDSDYITTLTGGTDISTTDNGGGAWTINYTGA